MESCAYPSGMAGEDLTSRTALRQLSIVSQRSGVKRLHDLRPFRLKRAPGIVIQRFPEGRRDRYRPFHRFPRAPLKPPWLRSDKAVFMLWRHP